MNKRSWLWVVAVWSWAALASAQVPPSEKAAAEALFDRGVAQLKEGKLEQACASLEQSQAIERGIGTMLYLADCYERTGRTASAWALFREAASEARASGQAERAEAGRQRAERLEPNLARLTVDVPEGSRVKGLEVTRDGVAVLPGAWGVSIPVDPGEHRIEARAAGYLTHAQSIVVAKGPGVQQVVVPLLAEAPVPVAESVKAQEPAPVAAPPPAAPLPERGRTQRLTGIVLGSAGVALLAVGGGFGIRAIKKKNEANDRCQDLDPCGDKEGVDASKDGHTAGTISTVGFAAGGALLAGGLITYLLAPKRETQVAFDVGPHGGVVRVGGVF